jgi:phenylacetate-CoA ligase
VSNQRQDHLRKADVSLLRQRDQNDCTFYDAWESYSDDQRTAVTRSRLTALIEHASAKSSFYANRLDGFQRNSVHPLAHVPVLHSNDLRKGLPPLSSDLIADAGDGYSVFQSGGTTGSPKSTLFTHQELELLTLHNARGFFACGLKREDRVANLFAVGGLYMTFLHIHRMLQEYGCVNFPFSNHTPADFVQTVAQQLSINVFAGISSVVLDTLRAIHAAGNGNIQLEKVYYGGEHFYEADKEELAQKFGTRTVLAPGYGTVDTWYIGYQCEASGTGEFHVHDDWCFTEIVDEETGKACEPGETGSLLATALPRYLMPVIRYRVGDRARWIPGRCACGRMTPRFKLLGRGDDVLRIGFDSVDYAYIAECVRADGRHTGTIQMEKRRRQGRDELIIRIESEQPLELRQDLAEKLRAAITNARPSLREFIEKETVWPVIVELVDTATLPRNPRTGKLMRVIDSIGEE